MLTIYASVLFSEGGTHRDIILFDCVPTSRKVCTKRYKGGTVAVWHCFKGFGTFICAFDFALKNISVVSNI
jgi:hypothetical protein